MDGRSIFIDEIDARDDTQVIDIKPYISIDKLEASRIKVPEWASRSREDAT